MDKLGICLECPICFQLLQDPRILPCAHTFCLACISQLCQQKSLRCPVCRVNAKVPANGYKGFPANYLVADLLSHMGDSNSDERANSDDKKNKSKKSRKTSVSAAEEAFCGGSHAPARAVLFCTTCYEAVCRQCAYNYHPKEEHECVPIGKSASVHRARLASMTKTTENTITRLAAARGSLHTEQFQVRSACANANDQVKSHFETLVARLHARKLALLHEIKAIEHQQTSILTVKLDRVAILEEQANGQLARLKSMQYLDDSQLADKMASFNFSILDYVDSSEPARVPYVKFDVDKDEALERIADSGALFMDELPDLENDIEAEIHQGLDGECADVDDNQAYDVPPVADYGDDANEDDSSSSNNNNNARHQRSVKIEIVCHNNNNNSSSSSNNNYHNQHSQQQYDFPLIEEISDEMKDEEEEEQEKGENDEDENNDEQEEEAEEGGDGDGENGDEAYEDEEDGEPGEEYDYQESSIGNLAQYVMDEVSRIFN